MPVYLPGCSDPRVYLVVTGATDPANNRRIYYGDAENGARQYAASFNARQEAKGATLRLHVKVETPPRQSARVDSSDTAGLDAQACMEAAEIALVEAAADDSRVWNATSEVGAKHRAFRRHLADVERAADVPSHLLVTSQWHELDARDRANGVYVVVDDEQGERTLGFFRRSEGIATAREINVGHLHNEKEWRAHVVEADGTRTTPFPKLVTIAFSDGSEIRRAARYAAEYVEAFNRQSAESGLGVRARIVKRTARREAVPA